jgi:DNA-binding Lrp family transcriptional regulator
MYNTRRILWRRRMSQTARKRKVKIKNDQLFIHPEQAWEIIYWIWSLGLLNKVKVVIEPCAGGADLLDLIHLMAPKGCKVEGYDLYPRRSDIVKQDFRTAHYPYNWRDVMIITGPPFGPHNKYAIEFLNLASGRAKYVVMILPKGFRSKESIHKQIHIHGPTPDSWFELYDEMELRYGAFYLPEEGDVDRRYSVGAVVQIWWVREPGERRRKISKKICRNTPHFTKDFRFTHKPQEANFAMKATGRSAGKIVVKSKIKKIPKGDRTHLFVAIDGYSLKVKAFLYDEKWKVVKDDVIGQRSIAMTDVVKAYGGYKWRCKS